MVIPHGESRGMLRHLNTVNPHCVLVFRLSNTALAHHLVGMPWGSCDKTDISIEVRLHCRFPVVRYRYGRMEGFRLDTFSKVDSEWLTDISGSGWCSKVLNSDDAYWFKIQLSKLSLLFILGAKGSFVGAVAGTVRSRKPHGARVFDAVIPKGGVCWICCLSFAFYPTEEATSDVPGCNG